MKVYRFAVHPPEDKYYFIECLNDPALFTQAKSMDEVVFMARDVVSAMYEYDPKDILIELVVPPDVETSFERRTKTAKRAKVHRRADKLAANARLGSRERQMVRQAAQGNKRRQSA